MFTKGKFIIPKKYECLTDTLYSNYRGFKIFHFIELFERIRLLGKIYVKTTYNGFYEELKDKWKSWINTAKTKREYGSQA